MDGNENTELARLSNALARAMVIGQVVYDTSGEGAEFREIVRHARELHNRWRATLNAEHPRDDAPERRLCEAMGNKLSQLESAERRPRSA